MSERLVGWLCMSALGARGVCHAYAHRYMAGMVRTYVRTVANDFVADSEHGLKILFA